MAQEVLYIKIDNEKEFNEAITQAEKIRCNQSKIATRDYSVAKSWYHGNSKIVIVLYPSKERDSILWNVSSLSKMEHEYKNEFNSVKMVDVTKSYLNKQ